MGMWRKFSSYNRYRIFPLQMIFQWDRCYDLSIDWKIEEATDV